MMVGKSLRGRSSGRCEDNTLILPEQNVSELGSSDKLYGKVIGFTEHNKLTEDMAKFSSAWKIFIYQISLLFCGTFFFCFRAVEYLIALGTPPSKIHLIGFSIGAHAAAYVAKAIPGIGRLTGECT
jgi:predicted esterase